MTPSQFPASVTPYAAREQRRVVTEHLGDLGRSPGERQPFDAFGVGILACGERTVGGAQLAEHVVERPGRDRAIPRVTGECPRVRVRARELRIVVEHLLEVRDEPLGVGRVAVEATAQLVMETAVGHRVERATSDRERPGVAGRDVAAQEELDRHRLRELRSAAPAAIGGIEPGFDGRRAPPRAMTASDPPSRRAIRLAWTRLATNRPPAASTAARSSRQARATPSRTWRNDGMPWRGSSGKYVPP